MSFLIERLEAHIRATPVATAESLALLEEAADELERLRGALARVALWAEAYPPSVFPVPDERYMRAAHELLVAHGMTLDRITADAMRHVVQGVGGIARAALDAERDPRAMLGVPDECRAGAGGGPAGATRDRFRDFDPAGDLPAQRGLSHAG